MIHMSTSTKRTFIWLGEFQSKKTTPKLWIQTLGNTIFLKIIHEHLFSMTTRTFLFLFNNTTRLLKTVHFFFLKI